ncbi:MAG: restriction endonuclease subunit S [Anaerolineae bacterium]|nr:restriction endonuclease subunit S [Anaerolineae bacterium]
MTVLNELIIASKDGEWGKGESFESSIEMLVIRGTDFEDVRVGTLDSVPIRHIAKRFAEYKSLQPYDIVIETAGGSKDRPTGRTLFVSPSLIYKSELPLICASFARFIRISPDLADPRYIFWLLQHMYDSGYMLKYHTQHTGVARFQWTTFANNEQLNLPSLSIQRRIASILSSYDDLIENNIRRIKALEQAAHDLYREWFVEFRFPRHESLPMVDSGTEYGMIPQGWEVGFLGDVAQDKRKNVQPSELEPDTPYVGLEHIPRKTIALSEWGMAGDVNSTKLVFEVGDILFAKIRPYLHKVAVAPVDGVSSSDAIIIVPKSLEFYSLVLMCVSDEHFVDYATTTSQGTQMPRANWNVLAEYPVVIPPKELLDEFNEFVSDIINDIRTNIFRNTTLRETRDLLLPRLVSGELDVSDIELGDLS